MWPNIWFISSLSNLYRTHRWLWGDLLSWPENVTVIKICLNLRFAFSLQVAAWRTSSLANAETTNQPKLVFQFSRCFHFRIQKFVFKKCVAGCIFLVTSSYKGVTLTGVACSKAISSKILIFEYCVLYSCEFHNGGILRSPRNRQEHQVCRLRS